MGAFFMWSAYFRMGAYKCDVVVEIKMGAYIHGVLLLCGCLLSRFYGMSIVVFILVHCTSTSDIHLTVI